MQDQVTINSIDETGLPNFVVVACTITISGTTYTQTLTCYDTDPIAVANDVKSQAEIFRQSVEALPTTVKDSDPLNSLAETVIDL